MQRLPEGQAHKGRNPGMVPILIDMEREALELAKVRSVGPKALGRYVSRLIYEDVARKEERERLPQVGMAE